MFNLIIIIIIIIGDSYSLLQSCIIVVVIILCGVVTSRQSYIILSTYYTHKIEKEFPLQNGMQFLAEYNRYLTMSRFNVTSDVYSQQCYDATWALAYALNDTLTGETSHIHSIPAIIISNNDRASTRGRG